MKKTRILKQTELTLWYMKVQSLKGGTKCLWFHKRYFYSAESLLEYLWSMPVEGTMAWGFAKLNNALIDLWETIKHTMSCISIRKK
jgi:hypothetical protein